MTLEKRLQLYLNKVSKYVRFIWSSIDIYLDLVYYEKYFRNNV